MSESIEIPRTTKHSFKKETTFGTAPTDVAGDSVLVSAPVTFRGLPPALIERSDILGHLGRLRPLHAGVRDDLGWDVEMKGRGSGTLNTAPELGQYLQCSFGKVSVGVNGTVSASPTPSTVGCTVSGATIAAGHIAQIQVGASTYETRLILTESSGAITWWPPVSAAPAEGYTVRSGVAYISTSTQSDYESGTGFWYFGNGEKLALSGAKGNCVITAQINQPLMFAFAMNANVSPSHSQTDCGYDWSPPDFEIQPPICLGIKVYAYIPAKVKTGSSTTAVLLKTTDGSTSYHEVTANSDKLIVDVSGDGSGTYETKTITAWNYGTQTATVSTLGGAPAADDNAYIQRAICVEDAITFDAGLNYVRTPCISNSNGFDDIILASRMPTVEWNRVFKSLAPLRHLENAELVDLLVKVGSTSGNQIALYARNVFREEFDLDLGGDYGTISLSGGIYSNSVSGGDEFYLTFL